jgi:hypothetical protein
MTEIEEEMKNNDEQWHCPRKVRHHIKMCNIDERNLCLGYILFQTSVKSYMADIYFQTIE